MSYRPYQGPLNMRKMDAVAAWAYRAWKNQKTRCYNQNAPLYRYYGGKGVRVLYSSRDFLGWAVAQKLPGPIGQIAIGRINHDDHYKFGNIEVVTRSANSQEMLLRNKNPANRKRQRAVVVFDGFGARLGRFDCISDAARAFSVDSGKVSRICSGVYKAMKNGIKFQYEASENVRSS